jgi:glycosyltransferase involved in cell wall biosynthesis
MITIISIMRNEAKWLPGYFESIHSLNLPVIIVDTGSTDESVTIAKKHGARVIEVGERFDWTYSKENADRVNQSLDLLLVQEGDRGFYFDQARAYADTWVKTPWALWLDIVDRCSGQLPPLDSSRNYTCDTNWNGYRFSTLRLYQPAHCKWQTPVHECLISDLVSEPISTFSIKRARSKGHAYDGMLAYFAIIESNPSARILYYFAQSLMDQKHFTQSRDAFVKAIQHPDLGINYQSHSMVYLGELSNDRQECRKWYLRAAWVFPAWRTPWIALAQWCMIDDDWVGALGYCNHALKIKPQSIIPEPIDYYTTVPQRIQASATSQGIGIYKNARLEYPN